MAVPQSEADLWSITNQQSGATQITASKAAGAAGVKHVARRVIAAFAVAATAQPAIFLNLRDGATGAGTVLLAWPVALPAASTGFFLYDSGPGGNLELPGTAATAMTIEFSAAGAANTCGTVNLIGYDLGTAAVAPTRP